MSRHGSIKAAERSQKSMRMAGDLSKLIDERIAGSLAAIDGLREQSDEIAAIANTLIDCLKRGGTVYTCGNGGSAAEALHLAEELIGRYRENRAALRAVCLNADPTALTCIANDFGFAEVFGRQCEALLTERDVLIAFSTSGKSENLLIAIEVAKDKKAKSIALVGKDGGPCLAFADLSLCVKSDDTAHIQEAHQVVMHVICEAVEAAFTAI